MKKTTFIETTVILYTILFLYTGISKLIDYSVFKEQIASSPILAPLAKPIALGLPWLEFLVTLLLIIPRWRLKGLFASLFLMSSFTVYILLILSFNKNIPCSCGGILAEMSWTQHIIFNCAFICFAVGGMLMEQRIKKTKHDEIVSNITSLTVG